MPKVKRSRKPPPEGWELIEPTLDELDQKMREGISFWVFMLLKCFLSPYSVRDINKKEGFRISPCYDTPSFKDYLVMKNLHPKDTE